MRLLAGQSVRGHRFRFLASAVAALLAVTAAACGQHSDTDSENPAATDAQAVPAEVEVDEPTLPSEESTSESSEFENLDAGSWHTCGVRTDGTIACWGDNRHGQSDAPAGQFITVTAGEAHSCGVRTDGTIACWGDNRHGQSDAPAGQFIAVTAGDSHSCGVRTVGTIACWPSSIKPSHGLFSAVTAEEAYTCGLRTDGTIECWGRDSHEAPPEGQFGAVTAGWSHACGLRTDGTVTCWSVGSNQMPLAPNGQFTAISTSAQHSCGLRADQTVTCWGTNSSGQARAPNGPFLAVATGYEHSCGLRTDRTVVCWGTVPDWLDAVTPPPLGVTFDDGSGLADPEACRPPGLREDHTAGFPLPLWAFPATGTLRVAVLFVDFPDAAATYAATLEAQMGLPYAEEYLETSSYSQLDIEFYPLHDWLRAAHSYQDYLSPSAAGIPAVAAGVVQEAIDLADPAVDFTEMDGLMVVMPSSLFGGGEGGAASELPGAATDEGAIAGGRLPRVNTFRLDGYSDSGAGSWGFTAAHELLHGFGLLDLYPYPDSLNNELTTPGDGAWTLNEFGPMKLGFYTPADYASTNHSGEMLSWSRWQLGWLDAQQVRCVTDGEAIVTLGPVADPGNHAAMVAIPLSDSEVVVAESRRNVGHDSGALLPEGVLVYTVDTNLRSGELPLRVAGDDGARKFDDHPLLEVGESVTVRGYEITAVADDGAAHTIAIARVDGQ